MTDNDERSTIDIFREMIAVTRLLILLETLEQFLKISKDGDEVKFLPLLKSMANYASK